VQEGIETEAQRDQIIDLGCDSSHGYDYAKPPLTAAALSEQLAASNALPLRLPAQRSAAGSMAPTQMSTHGTASESFT
jgi:predicted signal transduction protein with EAL and GGDEF domain